MRDVQKSKAWDSVRNEGVDIYGANKTTRKESRESSSSFTERIKKGAKLLLVLAIIGLFGQIATGTSKNVDTSNDAAEALETRVSTTLVAGTRLLSKDDNYVGGDLTITHNSSAQETKLYVWDYAAEDGDYVQIIVDGATLGNPFMIKNKPAVFTVPTTGNIQVVGTRDGGGGITYAVYFEMNKTMYVNGMNESGNNTYTLVYE